MLAWCSLIRVLRELLDLGLATLSVMLPLLILELLLLLLLLPELIDAAMTGVSSLRQIKSPWQLKVGDLRRNFTRPPAPVMSCFLSSGRRVRGSVSLVSVTSSGPWLLKISAK